MLRIRIRKHNDPLFRILVFNRVQTGNTLTEGVSNLENLKQVIMQKLGIDHRDSEMVLHLVQPPNKAPYISKGLMKK